MANTDKISAEFVNDGRLVKITITEHWPEGALGPGEIDRYQYFRRLTRVDNFQVELLGTLVPIDRDIATALGLPLKSEFRPVAVSES